MIVAASLLIIISLVLLVKNCAFSSTNFLGIKGVFIKYISLFKGARWQFVTIYIYPIPLAVGISLIYNGSETVYQNIIVVISIFISMLFSMMSILSAKDMDKYADIQREKVVEVLRDTNCVIVFCTCIAIMDIILCLILLAIPLGKYHVLRGFLWTVVLYVFITVLLNILFIVKRLSKML